MTLIVSGSSLNSLSVYLTHTRTHTHTQIIPVCATGMRGLFLNSGVYKPIGALPQHVSSSLESLDDKVALSLPRPPLNDLVNFKHGSANEILQMHPPPSHITPLVHRRGGGRRETQIYAEYSAHQSAQCSA